MAIVGVTIAVIAISGCAKDDTVVVGNSVLVTSTVSFNNDIIPLFAKNCALSGCHIKGSVAPDLEAGTALSQLNSMGLINASSPENSIIYQRLMGAITPAMPLNATPNPGNINGYILAWIKQGTNNN